MGSILRTLAAACCALLLLVGLNVGSAQASTVEVKLGTDSGMLAFEPATVTIKAGDTALASAIWKILISESWRGRFLKKAGELEKVQPTG